jgi:hypothetical protein
MGGGKKDLSILFLYSSIDRYLREGGRLGFVITQTVFQTTGAGEGFRNFSYPSQAQKPGVIRVGKVHDMVKIRPFENATNWTATIACEKGKVTRYPVSYIKWDLKPGNAIEEDMPLETVLERTSRSQLQAQPSDANRPNSVWTASTPSLHGVLDKISGRFAYEIHEGVNPGGAVGIYWLKYIQRIDKRVSLFENLPDLAKKKVKKQTVALENEVTFPHLRWGDVEKWHAEHSHYILVPQDFDTRIGIDPSTMKRDYPKAYSYLSQFKSFLLSRTKSVPKDPFYSMLGISTAALSKYKICWRALGEKRIKPVVVGWIKDAHLGRETPILCQWTCYFISSQVAEEAHFVCGLLGSSPINVAIRIRGVSGGKNFGSAKQFASINFPKYEPKNGNHKTISVLSTKCHAASTKGDEDTVKKLEAEIDRAAAELWGITLKELEQIQKALKGA